MTKEKENQNCEPLISVVVPIYNVQAYLKECVDSILNQTYGNLEVILVDDESSDSCGKICDEYKLFDRRVKVIHKKNGGLSDARNAGIKIAKGDYITFVDSDDYIAENLLSILYKAIQKYDAGIAIANMKRTSKRNEKGDEDCIEVIQFKSEDALTRMLYGNPFGTSACGKLFEMTLFNGIEFPYRKFSEDLFTIYRTILKCAEIVYVDFYGYFYFYREEGSIVVSKYSEKQLEALDAIDNIVRDVREYSKYRKAVASQYINVVYDIAARNPELEEFKNPRIQMTLKKYRVAVVLNGEAPRRLRAFCVLSYLGNKILLRVIVARNAKWKV